MTLLCLGHPPYSSPPRSYLDCWLAWQEPLLSVFHAAFTYLPPDCRTG